MASRVPVTVTVNGQQHVGDVEPRLLLVHFLRDSLGLTGTHVGCDTSNCGACTVHVDGEAVKSCTVLAVQADGARSRRSRAWAATASCIRCRRPSGTKHGLQCGYCTPGMIMAAADLLARNSATRPRRTSARRWRATCAAARATRTSSRPCWPWPPGASRGGGAGMGVPETRRTERPSPAATATSGSRSSARRTRA